VILKLGLAGKIHRVEVDTAHFKGNFPESCSLEACSVAPRENKDASLESADWKEVLPRMLLRANRRHFFRKLQKVGAISHVRFNIYPDGGVSRLRIFGEPVSPEDQLKGLDRINQLPAERARKALLDCCGSIAWADQMISKRPFAEDAKLFASADEIWTRLDPNEWLRAIRRHPPIGGRRGNSKQSGTAREWSAREQSEAQTSSAETLAVLNAANQAYRATFGYVFLICATGKSGDEILQSLRQRLANDPETELRVAADEMRKITRLRLEKLLNS
jgi:allantoicase